LYIGPQVVFHEHVDTGFLPVSSSRFRVIWPTSLMGRHIFRGYEVVHTNPGHAPAAVSRTRSSTIAEGPRDASRQLKSCQLPRTSADTTCTTTPEQIEVMELEGYSGTMCNKL